MATILVTAFEPFGGEDRNPALDAMRALPKTIAGTRIATCVVPTEFNRSIRVVTGAIEKTRPVAVLAIGQAGGRAAVTPERVAINLDDARIPDNAGAQPLDQPIVADGPAAYFSTLPVKAMVQAIRAAGVPAELSHTAGTYVCNHLMYGILHQLRDSHTRAGFVHVPYASEQVAGRADTPSLPLDSIVTALTAAIEAIVKNDEDIALVAGTTH